LALPSAATKAEPSEWGWPLLSVSSKVTLPPAAADCGAGETWTVRVVLPEAPLAGAVVSVVVVGTAVGDWPKAADASARTAAATGSARKDQREDDSILREADCKSKSLVESIFGTGLDHPALTLVAFPYGKSHVERIFAGHHLTENA
jgi:hypothetical protein